MNTKQDEISNTTASFALSLLLASITNSILVIVKEKSPAVMKGMASMTGHHWITHSIVVLGLFFLVGFIFSKLNSGRGIKMSAGSVITTLVSGVVVGTLLIAGFYLVGD